MTTLTEADFVQGGSTVALGDLRSYAASHGVARVVETAFGSRYHVDNRIETPDGRNPVIRSVWQVDTGFVHPRFIAAHPRRR